MGWDDKPKHEELSAKSFFEPPFCWCVQAVTRTFSRPAVEAGPNLSLTVPYVCLHEDRMHWKVDQCAEHSRMTIWSKLWSAKGMMSLCCHHRLIANSSFFLDILFDKVSQRRHHSLELSHRRWFWEIEFGRTANGPSSLWCILQDPHGKYFPIPSWSILSPFWLPVSLPLGLFFC